MAWVWLSASPTKVSEAGVILCPPAAAKVLLRTVKELDNERLTFVIN